MAIKFPVRVVGHEMKFVKVEVEMVELVVIKLKGIGADKIEVKLVLDADQRARYPFGSTAVLDFNVQQEARLEK